MNTIKTFTFFFLLLNWNCQDKQEVKSNIPLQYKIENAQNDIQFYSDKELNQLWDSLCLKKGCLVGGQYVGENGSFGGEGCVLTIDKQWRMFLFKTDKRSLATFLIEQLKDKTKTQTHTCPYDVATKGELAIYCLQGILKSNFYDLSNEPALSDTDLYKKYGSNQKWIWHIQSSKREIELLQKLWKEELGENSSKNN